MVNKQTLCIYKIYNILIICCDHLNFSNHTLADRISERTCSQEVKHGWIS